MLQEIYKNDNKCLNYIIIALIGLRASFGQNMAVEDQWQNKAVEVTLILKPVRWQSAMTIYCMKISVRNGSLFEASLRHHKKDQSSHK